METLIRQAFLHVDLIGQHVLEGHFDLTGPDGEIILPQVWDTVIQPGVDISMHMWPMPEPQPMYGGPGGFDPTMMDGMNLGGRHEKSKKSGKKSEKDKKKDRKSTGHVFDVPAPMPGGYGPGPGAGGMFGGMPPPPAAHGGMPPPPPPMHGMPGMPMGDPMGGMPMGDPLGPGLMPGGHMPGGPMPDGIFAVPERKANTKAKARKKSELPPFAAWMAGARGGRSGKR